MPSPLMADAARQKVKLTIEPRGLSRVQAALYVGIGTTKFDDMVSDGRMPRPRVIDSRKVWDRRELDAAFEDLPTSDARQVSHKLCVSITCGSKPAQAAPLFSAHFWRHFQTYHGAGRRAKSV